MRGRASWDIKTSRGRLVLAEGRYGGESFALFNENGEKIEWGQSWPAGALGGMLINLGGFSEEEAAEVEATLKEFRTAECDSDSSRRFAQDP